MSIIQVQENRLSAHVRSLIKFILRLVRTMCRVSTKLLKSPPKCRKKDAYDPSSLDSSSTDVLDPLESCEEPFLARSRELEMGIVSGTDADDWTLL